MRSARSKAARGFIIFNRHGHRAPGRNVMIEGESEEIKLWKSFVDGSTSKTEESSPIQITQHPANSMARDLITRPFGCITTTGREHLRQVGRNISNFFPDLKDVRSENLLVYATNYQRTQASAQMLLSGIFTSDDDFEKFSIDTSSVQVQVRSMTECAMSFYDGFPMIAKKFFLRAQSTDEFKERESRAAIVHTKDSLAGLIPGLLIKGGSKGQSLEHTFDWLGAFDYFACREAHCLPLIPGTEQFSDIVRRHLAARYGDYYRDPLHLAHAAVSLLLDLEREIHAISSASKASTPSSNRLPTGENAEGGVGEGLGGGSGRGTCLTLFSGHDITVLALLHALKADIMVGETAQSLSQSAPPFWPDYGSSIVFKVDDAESYGHEGQNLDLKSSKISVYFDLNPLSVRMNGSPVSSVCFTVEELRTRIEALQLNLTPVE